MGHSNGKITAPVSVQDVRYVLGAASTDVGTLCINANINMWSKMKPMHYLNKLDELTLTQAAEYNDAFVYHYGIRIKQTFTGLASNKTTRKGFVYESADFDGVLNGWEYARPYGSAASPYRLTDFNGYNHKAPKPLREFSIVSGGGASVKKNDQVVFGLRPTAQNDSGDYVTLFDFFNSKNNAPYNHAYIGVVAIMYTNGSPNGQYLVNCTTDLSNNIIQLPLLFDAPGTFKVFPILMTQPMSEPNEVANNLVCGIPYTSPIDVTVLSETQQVSMSLRFTYDSATNTIKNVYVDMHNYTSSAITFINNKLMFCDRQIRNDNDSGTANLSDTGVSIPSFTLAANGSISNKLITSSLNYPANISAVYKYLFVSFNDNNGHMYTRTQIIDLSLAPE